jgi:hypothetical protein
MIAASQGDPARSMFVIDRATWDTRTMVLIDEASGVWFQDESNRVERVGSVVPTVFAAMKELRSRAGFGDFEPWADPDLTEYKSHHGPGYQKVLVDGDSDADTPLVLAERERVGHRRRTSPVADKLLRWILAVDRDAREKGRARRSTESPAR